MKTIAALQAWNNFSEYYAGKVGELVKEKYQMTITYNQDIEYLKKFDIIWSFFPQRVNDPELLKKTVKTYWEKHEMGQNRGKVNVACSRRNYDLMKNDGITVLYAPMGVDPNDFFPQPWDVHKKLVVGWCGIVKNAKKQYYKLKEMLNEIPEVVFDPHCIVGVNEYNQGKYKTVPEMRNYYQKIDVYVCASGYEGFGLPILEASACGRSVVTFDVGIASELRSHGAGIIIVKDFDEMRKILLLLAKSPGTVTESGMMSAETVKRFWLWPNFREAWLKVFDSV